MNNKKKISNSLSELYDTITKLRSPDGCDWDNKQTSESLISYLLEETHEVIQSIENKDSEGLKEELGDLLLHIFFQVQLAEEKSSFTLNEVLQAINNKLKHRHPQIFDDSNAVSNDGWEMKKYKDKKRNRFLDGVPITLPALTRSSRIQEKASHVGFDWNDIQPVFIKLFEEIDELKAAIDDNNQESIMEEVGDLLFTIVNLSRFLSVNPESALNKSTLKFEDRFSQIESVLKNNGKSLMDSSLDEMDEIWNNLKKDKENEKI